MIEFKIEKYPNIVFHFEVVNENRIQIFVDKVIWNYIQNKEIFSEENIVIEIDKDYHLLVPMDCMVYFKNPRKIRRANRPPFLLEPENIINDIIEEWKKQYGLLLNPLVFMLFEQIKNMQYELEYLSDKVNNLESEIEFPRSYH